MSIIKFLGTAGARFVVMMQLRYSAGIYVESEDTRIIIDPGPGTLVRCAKSKPKIDPRKIDGLIITHRHLDHSNDANIMIEAMSNGGFKKRGLVFATDDALDDDPVIFSYVREYPEEIVRLKAGGKYEIKNVSFETPVQNDHSVQTYGVNLFLPECKVSYVSDTRYFEDIPRYYDGEVLILDVVLFKPKGEHIKHLSLEDAEVIISKARPKLTVLTHFGMTMIKAKPWEQAEELAEKLKLSVIAARDGQTLNLADTKILSL